MMHCRPEDAPPHRGTVRRSGLRWAVAVAIAVSVAALNMLAWRALNPPLPVPDAPARVGGLAYNTFQRWDSPLSKVYPNTTEIEADMRLLAGTTQRLRTYSASEFPALPALAQQHGLKLALGVWLDTGADSNEREIRAAIDTARRHGNVERVIAGNETQLHRKLSPTQLYATLDRLRAAVTVPVSTAEPWHVWVYQPELARHVDFITVHLLPYWEGVSVKDAVEDSLQRYRMVRERHPHKPVVIGEIGWPSGGDTVRSAEATPANQAAFVREFVARAAALKLDYYLMEAVDQPWKRATEGRVGAFWGLRDAWREPKFEFSGPVYADPYWSGKAALSSVIALAALLPFLLRFAALRLPGRITFALALQAVASFVVLLAALPLDQYLRTWDVVLLMWLVPALALMGAILLAQVFEFAELFWDGSLSERAAPQPLPAHEPAPFVSIHLACCNEPPEMVIETINSLLELDWPVFEVLVVDNNTSDASRWQPVRDHVEAIQARSRRDAGAAPQVRFFHLPSWPGYKAGALNFALEHTHASAAWVAVVDADYVVAKNWLRDLGGWLHDGTVGAVQSPQAHRDWGARRLHRMMNWEYDGFFRIGMHHRHERGAVVQHGTMTLVRASALRALQGWATDCICEDTELGLRLLQQRYRVVYVDRVLGTGLLPSDFGAYQRQRRRWAQGGMQILRRHVRGLIGLERAGAVPAGAVAGSRPGLTASQRYHFLAGWLPWIGDGLHLLFSGAAMWWTLGVLVAPQLFGLPIGLFVVPLAVFFFTRLLLVPLMYARRVPCPKADIVGAAWAGMALSHSIARGVLAGLGRRGAVFEVTRKGPAAARPARAGVAWSTVREEAALLLGLGVCIVALLLQPGQSDPALPGWLLVLVLQAIPYAAALGCALLDRAGSGLGRQPSAARQGAAHAAWDAAPPGT